MKHRAAKHGTAKHGVVKESRFPASLFAIYLGVLFLMSGIHSGLIVFMDKAGVNGLLPTIMAMAYWGIVAIGLTLFTRKKIKDTYEEPLHKLAKATDKVANGDFSVYVPTIHTQNKWDYLDVMIVDFNKMVEELGSIETLKTDFVSNVSHEMKTPIAIIKNYAELLKTEPITQAQRKEYAEGIEGAAIRLSNLISNILRLNKLENQRMTPEVATYDVCRQLCECILQFEDAWDEKEIQLETEIEDFAMIEADESLLELVWSNLLSNAVKFTEPGGTITIKQTSDEGFVTISVSDTGCGIDRDTIKHIFDKFYQGDTSHSKEGNGLGLALVKRVLELLDGDIQVFSERGKGSTFLVRIPAAGVAENSNGGSMPNPKKTVLRLKRNRKIVNKMELTRLQRNFEACVEEIDALENAKTSVAAMYALIVAIIGTAFMAGSVFAVTAEPPHIVLCIVLAVPAFLGWIIPYFLHKKIVEKQTEKLTPLIEEKYDEIYEICEKGNKLLY